MTTSKRPSKLGTKKVKRAAKKPTKSATAPRKVAAKPPVMPIKPAHDLVVEGIGSKFHAALREAGLGNYSAGTVHLTSLQAGVAPPNCRMVLQPDGSYKLDCS